MDTLSLYIHWPFCASKCPYCDFNSHVRAKIEENVWQAALLQDLRSMAEKTKGRTLKSIFFGGGTPSLMAPSTVSALIEEASRQWTPALDLEITLEANPNSVEARKFRAFKQAGVNRVSLGIQSLRETDLKVLGRLHGVEEAKEAIRIASSLFDRFSFDLIYARHQQTLKEWKEELNEALKMASGHLSLYQLTIEPGTAYYTLHERGAILTPGEDLAADFYDLTQELTGKAGLPAYEISNHARGADEESRHNLAYWRSEDYAGIGPGAHGRLTMGERRFATKGYRAPETWLDHVKRKGSGLEEEVVLEPREIFKEKLMMGLRLKEGVSLPPGAFFEEGVLLFLLEEDLLMLENGRLRTTSKGRLCLNGILSYLFSKMR